MLESADSLNRLIEPFLDPEVGMVGGRPLPTNEPDNLAGFTVQLMWNMHHLVALQKPKTGELIAFREKVAYQKKVEDKGKKVVNWIFGVLILLALAFVVYSVFIVS